MHDDVPSYFLLAVWKSLNIFPAEWIEGGGQQQGLPVLLI